MSFDPSLLAAPEDMGISASVLEQIGPTVQQLIDDGQLAGAVTIVARRGKVVQFEAFGQTDIDTGQPTSRDTIFPIYSMTKAVGSVAALMLIEEGRLRLDAEIQEYLPELGGMQVALDPGADELTLVPAHREMTVRDVLRHTSGLPGANMYMAGKTKLADVYRAAGLDRLHECDLQEMVERLGTTPLVYQPGTGWQYSIAAEVTGRLIEVASGRRFDEFLAERILQPLEMVDTGFFVPVETHARLAAMHGPNDSGGVQKIGAPQSGTIRASMDTFKTPVKFLSNGGGLVSTAADYMRFCLLLDAGGALGSTRLLSPQSVERMTASQLPGELIPIDKMPRERYAGLGFGLGVSVRTEHTTALPAAEVGEYGWIGGASTEFWISPRDELITIVLAAHMPFAPLSWAVKRLVYAAVGKE
jgi:CubicO group peptidase (beta-lactamase class C family)